MTPAPCLSADRAPARAAPSVSPLPKLPAARRATPAQFFTSHSRTARTARARRTLILVPVGPAAGLVGGHVVGRSGEDRGSPKRARRHPARARMSVRPRAVAVTGVRCGSRPPLLSLPSARPRPRPPLGLSSAFRSLLLPFTNVRPAPTCKNGAHTLAKEGTLAAAATCALSAVLLLHTDTKTSCRPVRPGRHLPPHLPPKRGSIKRVCG